MTSQDLLKTALLGTARDTVAPGNDIAAGDELAPFFCGASSEKALWNAAVALTMQAYAGGRAARSDLAAPASCAPEQAPYMPPVVAWRGMQLAGKDAALWREWLQLVAQKGWIAPPEILPDLLDFGRGSREARPLILPILGERGRWLAAQNPDWRTIAAPRADDAQATWETGAFPARLEALRETRELDADLAREWVESVWTQETARERDQLLEVLALNLSEADEPFLEAALNDKSKDVRIQAAELLSRLPDSAYTARMWERAQKYVTWKNGHIEIQLPEAWNKSWAKDGIFEIASSFARTKLGDKAFWLSQLIARVPPAQWEAEWGIDGAAIARGMAGEWEEMLRAAFFEAQTRSNDFRWFLLWVEGQNPTVVPPDYASRLPASVAELLIERVVMPGVAQSTNFFEAGELSARLTQVVPQWSAPLSHWLLDSARAKISDVLERDSRRPQDAWSIFGVLSVPNVVKLAPDTLEAALSNWPTQHPHWDWAYPYARTFFDAVQTRLDMRREIETA